MTYGGGGGGGGISTATSASTGGSGGGGNGGLGAGGVGQNGTDGLGGGGGGGTRGAGAAGGNGGSGIVIVRYEGPALTGLVTTTTSATGTITPSSFTGNGTNGTNGQLYQVNSFTIGSSTTNGTFSFDMSGVDLNARLGTTMSGVISGTGGLTYNGLGRLTLSASNTYTGGTVVSAGSLVGSTTSLQGAITNNAAVTFDQSTAGTYSGAMSGSGSLNKTGIGRLSLSGSSSYNGATTVSAGELNLSGGSIANSAVTVASGASLSGYGSVGTIGGAGAINPGNSPGILTGTQVDPSGGTTFNLEMTGTAPTYSSASNSVNDVIRITGATPFSQALAGNVINIYFSGAALFTGSTAVQYQGGFFTDQSASFASSISGATYNYYFANASGTNSYNGANYYTKAQYETAVLSSDLMTITVTTVAQTANFGSGNINGQVMQVQVVPEPSTYALLALAVAGWGAHAWRRRKQVS